MLARAVVVETGRTLPPGKEGAGRGLVDRQMGAADQVAGGKTSPDEEPPGPLHVPGLTAVRGADEGDVPGAQAECLCPPGLEQREGLEGLGRGAQKRRQSGVPAGPGQLSGLVGAVMADLVSELPPESCLGMGLASESLRNAASSSAPSPAAPSFRVQKIGAQGAVQKLFIRHKFTGRKTTRIPPL